MIMPTVGRVVWYYRRSQTKDYGEPFAAVIACVLSYRCVNLMVIAADGVPYSRTSVPLVQPDSPVLKSEYSEYCEWMPYQIGQAAKTEHAERQAAMVAKL